ncbi:S1C family serine protease [Halanaeroarchaeum sulfurireducens]|nr:trypsin-like peptidase domain-containing protein [Halanaeroarchaeum sulfurireducens]
MTRQAVRVGLVVLVVGLVVGGSVGAVIGASMVIPGPALQAPGGDDPGSVAEDRGNATRYERLYERTIDSVVMITVGNAMGGAQGSGFVYDRNHVVTNQHVVEDADEVGVQFADGSHRTATVVGVDAYTDLAVVRVPNMPPAATPLPVDTVPPQPGEPVVALGSPFGLDGTITHGIVSGVNRSMTVEGGFTIPDTVQTDAPINPGNSGGPLVSTDGTVVGVNRAKGGDNVGFAISAAVVESVVPALIEDGEYEHAYLGIRSLPVTPQIASVNDLEHAYGVMVVETDSSGPSESVFQVAETTTVDGVSYPTGGDVIVEVEDREIRTSQQLSRYLLLHTHPGQTVSVTVIRDGERTTVEVTLDRRPPV